MQAARKDLLQRIQRKLADDAVNGFLFQYPRLDIWNAHVHGIGFDNVLGVVDVTHAYIDDTAQLHHDDELTAAAAIAPPAFRIAGGLFLTGTLGLLILSVRRFGSAYLAARAAVLLATLLAATVVVFVIVQVVPGDPVRYMMGLQADPGSVAAMRHQLGLDAGPMQRYGSWIGGLLHADFGLSYTYRVPVGALLAERLQVSLPLALYALLLSIAAAFPSALYAAARRGRPVTQSSAPYPSWVSRCRISGWECCWC